MKTDLATSIGVAIVGVIIAFFVCNLLVGDPDPISFKTIDYSVTADLASPDIEVFNYRALNPTVEVYVGECNEYDANGNCIDGSVIDDNTIIEEDTTYIDENSTSDEGNIEPTDTEQPTPGGGTP